MEQLIASILISALAATLLTLCSLKMLQILQLSSYRTGGFVAWIRRTRFDYPRRYFALFFFQILSLIMFSFAFRNEFRYFGLILYVVLAAYYIFLQFKNKQKTPLKVTKRVQRLLAVLAAMYFGLSFVAIYFLFETVVGFSLVAVLTLLIPLVSLLAAWIMHPFESLVHRHYKRKATVALRDSGIICVGITGSYGKTTAKNILTAMLAKKYRVLSSPESHNTPMGIAKLVNGGLDDCEIFVAEMGARHRGDIAELCDMVRPAYGLITVTGPQHLETFGDLQTVIKTKLELAECASVVVLNSDDSGLVDAAKRLLAENEESSTKPVINAKSDKHYFGDGGKKQFLYSGTAGADASYFDARLSDKGTSFTINIGGKSVKITTQLLGRHIPALIAQCALLSHRLGVSLSEIKAAAEQLKPVPHRLQLIKTPNSLVIDDAYNANPEGAKNALEVLGLFDSPRVVITPGFVELGEILNSENRRLGERAAAAADFLFSVGSKEIAEGAIGGGMDEMRAKVVSSLDEAMEQLTALKLTNPVILFLNDLPDNY